MHQTFDDAWEQAGRNYQKLDHYSLPTMVNTEDPDSPLSTMIDYWLELKNRTRAAPATDSFQLHKLWEMKIPDKVTIIDCSPEDLTNFTILHHAGDITNENWFFGKRVTGHRIGTLPSQMHSTALQIEYQGAKTFSDVNALRYSRVRQYINGAYRDYMRLLLPFAGPNGNITMLASVVQLQSRIRDDS